MAQNILAKTYSSNVRDAAAGSESLEDTILGGGPSWVSSSSAEASSSLDLMADQ